MIRYSVNKKQYQRIMNMAFKKMRQIFFVLSALLLILCICHLIVGLLIDKEIMTTFYGLLGVWLFGNIVMLITWLLYLSKSEDLFKASSDGEGVEYICNYDFHSITITNVVRNNVMTYDLKNINRLYISDDLVGVVMNSNNLVPIVRSEETEELVDLLIQTYENKKSLEK